MSSSVGATRALLLLAVLAGAVACRTPVAPLDPLPADDARAARLLAEHAALAESRHGLRARTRVSLEGRAGEGFARQLLLVSRPDRLRLEVLGLAGQRVAALATDGLGYDVFRAESGRIESGEVHPGILDEFVGVPIRPAAGAAILLGVPNLGNDSNELFAGGDDRVFVRWWAGEQLHQAVFGADGQLSGLRIEAALGGTSLQAEWGDYRDVEGVPFAHRVRIEVPPAGVAAEVEFLQVELNPKLDPALFRLANRRLSSPAGGD